MSLPGSISAPALLRRAFFISAVSCIALTLRAAPPLAAPPPLQTFGHTDSAEARDALEHLRHQGIAGNYYLEFDLRVLPRRGEERTYHGRMWGTHGDGGPLTRVSLLGPNGTPERRLLIQSGPHPALWRWEAGKGVEQLGVAASFEALLPDVQVTAFDLQMPFVYWQDFTFEGLQRYRGRPAYMILLRPPADWAAKHLETKGVRVYLDTQFNALVQTEVIGADGTVEKTVALLDLKKVGEQWIPKAFDVRDEASRNKTRLLVTAAALGIDFSRALFEPAQLDDDIRPPAGSELERFGP